MTPEEALWTREQAFWDSLPAPRIDDREIAEENGTAVLTYRVADASRILRCKSIYTRTLDTWILVEHEQFPA